MTRVIVPSAPRNVLVVLAVAVFAASFLVPGIVPDLGSGAAFAQAGAGSGPATGTPAAPDPSPPAGAPEPPPATPTAPPATSPASTEDARKACTAAMNADPQFAAAIVKTADEQAALQRDRDTVKAHVDANLHIQKNQRHVIYGYAAMWVIAAGFVIFLWRRQQGLKDEIASLRRDLEAAGEPPSKGRT
jgi:hypothetical protein